MSDIIYLKDILIEKDSKKKRAGRQKLKPFNQKIASRSRFKSSLAERAKTKDRQYQESSGYKKS